MAKVICKLPNASTNINGIRFVTHRDGMISEEIDDAVALTLSDIPGYEIHDPGQTDKVAAAVLEAARKKAADEAAAADKAKNSAPPAPPAGAPSSPAGAATPPAGTPPAAPPAGAETSAGGETGKGDTPDPNF